MFKRVDTLPDSNLTITETTACWLRVLHTECSLKPKAPVRTTCFMITRPLSDCYALWNIEAGHPPWVIISWMFARCVVGTHLRETFLWIQIMITVYRWVFVIQVQEILKIRRVVDAAAALFFCKGLENKWKLLQPCHQDEGELVKVEFLSAHLTWQVAFNTLSLCLSYMDWSYVTY